ncbi:hypothetical protein OF001_U170048 [Pseudomonas sp. OF001]|nr:hypothetical protein OF001_U170048 [Pseudomonas sp. OF001]
MVARLPDFSVISTFEGCQKMLMLSIAAHRVERDALCSRLLGWPAGWERMVRFWPCRALPARSHAARQDRHPMA